MSRTSDGPSTFGDLVVRHRRASGLTQEALAEASGMSVRALRDLERGHTQAAQRRSTEVLAQALGLSGEDRARFLAVAHEGRRRAVSPPRPPAPARAGVSTLPAALPDLVGRELELTRLAETGVGDGAIVAVVGHPGVGKTVLAISAAHRLRATFPDGCLAVDLRGLDDEPVSPRAALDRLLRGLGVASSEIPASETDRADLYRSVLAGRRVLVLLDNAAEEAQVRPLLVVTPGCLTLVTCRRALAALEGVRWLWLDPLAESDAVGLLANIVGPDRVRAEPSAAEEIATLCGNLPLAVRIAGNRLATRPNWSLAYLATLLRDERRRLGSLSVGDLQVRSAFELSYRRLAPDARGVFRRLAALPGSDFGPELAGVAAGVDELAAEGYLDEFADANLLQMTAVEGRFQFHDLIRLFVIERWEAEETAADREKTRHAVLTHLLCTAGVAGSRLKQDVDPDTNGPSETEALAWLQREESSWLAALRAAARLGWHRELIRTIEEVNWYADHWWFGLPWVEIFELGVVAARALGDRSNEAEMLNRVGWAHGVCLGDRSSSLARHEQALAVAVEVGDRFSQAEANAFIGTALMFLGRLEEALDHAGRAIELAEGFEFWTVELPIRHRYGRVLERLGRFAEALAVYRAVLADCEAHGGSTSSRSRRMVTVYVTEGVGDCLVGLGEWQLAAETFRETRLARVELGSTGNAAVAALNEGRAWLGAGEYARARESLRYALAAYGEWAPSGRAEVLAELARLPRE
ncbi:MAG TPA: NB-ARC domain-containing protein [Actinophytocola sp.]|nr:NB-ARC domain-containing protein [Actinophytocola sp.]